jgi:hypothetical protein
MSDLKKYITGRKKTNKEFAKSYEEGFENFKIGILLRQAKTIAERAKKGDWKKAREILAKAPDTEAEDDDKL